MAVVDVSFPGNLSQVASLADLRALPSSYLREDAYLVAGVGLYTFDGGSLGADDNASIIRPNDRSPLQAGRWIGSAAPGGDNVFTTYAALIGSDGAKKAAQLVPQAGETEPAGIFSYIDGSWVRQPVDGLTYTLPAALGQIRSQANKNADAIDVWDFMTPAMKASVEAGNLSVDTAPAFQAALDYASGKSLNANQSGRRVRFRGGTYRWDTPVTFDWRATVNVIDAGDLRRPALEGDGSANTAIYYTGPAGSPALSIAGYSSGANGGVDLFLELSGFWLRRAFATAQTGTGIRFNQSSFIRLTDVGVDQFDRNLDIIDTIRLHAIGCRFTGANESVFARVAIYSHPNVYKFDRCDFGGNFKRVARFTTPANVVFSDCGMEGNGDGTDHLIAINGGPQEGGCGFELRGGYIENSFALSEVFLNWTAANNNGTAKISGVSFGKTGTSRLVNNHILVSAEPPSAGRLMVHIDSCAFKGFGYTPSVSRPVVAQTTNSGNALVTFSGNHFDNDVERPQLNGWPAVGDGYSQLAASVRFADDGTMSSQWNVASITKVNVGEYGINYKRQLRQAEVHMTWGKVGPGVTQAYVKNESPTGCVIVTTDGAGTAADRAISVELRGLLN